MHRWANMHSHSDAQVWMHTWINTELHFTFCYKHTDLTLDQKQTHRWQTLGLTNGMNKPSLMLTVAAFSCHSKQTTSEGFTQCWKDNTMTRLTVWTTQGSLLFPVASRHSEQSYKAERLNISLCERPFLSRRCGNAGIITILFAIYMMEKTKHWCLQFVHNIYQHTTHNRGAVPRTTIHKKNEFCLKGHVATTPLYPSKNRTTTFDMNVQNREGGLSGVGVCLDWVCVSLSKTLNPKLFQVVRTAPCLAACFCKVCEWVNNGHTA